MNNHDKLHDEQGVFTYKNKWLLVLNHKTDQLYLQQYAGDIIHLTAVVLHSNTKVTVALKIMLHFRFIITLAEGIQGSMQLHVTGLISIWGLTSDNNSKKHSKHKSEYCHQNIINFLALFCVTKNKTRPNISL